MLPFSKGVYCSLREIPTFFREWVNPSDAGGVFGGGEGVEYEVTCEDSKKKRGKVCILRQCEYGYTKKEKEKWIVYDVVRHERESLLEEKVGDEVDIRQKGKAESKCVKRRIEMTPKKHGNNDVEYGAKRKVFDHRRRNDTMGFANLTDLPLD